MFIIRIGKEIAMADMPEKLKELLLKNKEKYIGGTCEDPDGNVCLIVDISEKGVLVRKIGKKMPYMAS